jgi:hypothetical protein
LIICFECPPKIKALLDGLIETEQYEDYAQAITSAIENLSVLQGELTRKGALVIGAEEDGSLPIKPQVKGRKAVQRSKNAVTDKEDRLGTLLTNTMRIPEIFQLDGIGESSSPIALPSDIWMKGQEVPLDRWIFGQYNKLLPAKANCRALAHLLKDQPKGVPLNEAASTISQQALVLGDFLTRSDKQSGAARDDMLSIAFPSSSDKAEKSRLRYAHQFVASVNKQGQVSGLLIDLKLINHTDGKDPHLLLTKAGWRFATLPNSVLDSVEEGSTEKFTAEEKSFLLDHISSSVPAEDFAYRAILSAIAESANTPDKIDAALQRYISRDAYAHLSKSFFSTQRSGAISRMADLGLVARVRSGVRVSYVVTAGGQAFMENKI